MQKLNYFKRILSAYIFKKPSHLNFWIGTPRVNPYVNYKELEEYYQTFEYKADYKGHFDDKGVVQLDYRGKIGKQYYPIAIAQYGLACYNKYKRTLDKGWLEKSIIHGNWLVDNFTENNYGIHLWYANFDWEYRELLKAPWPSALAQANGISLLVRLYQETRDERYLLASKRAYEGLITDIRKGGVALIKGNGTIWFEEVLVEPSTHILNGFMWSIMGVYDYYLLTNSDSAKDILDKSIHTLKNNLPAFDIGFWSLYELSGTKMDNMTSCFYHSLHIVQLQILYNITGVDSFRYYSARWANYEKNIFFKALSQIHKALFKLIYY